MKKEPKATQKASTEKLIKVQLDYRTIITLKTKNALNFWLNKYPEAKVLTN